MCEDILKQFQEYAINKVKEIDAKELKKSLIKLIKHEKINQTQKTFLYKIFDECNDGINPSEIFERINIAASEELKLNKELEEKYRKVPANLKDKRF